MPVPKFLFLLLFCWTIARIAHAVGVPHLSIPDLVAASDVIAIAEAGEPRLIGPAAPIEFHGILLKARNYSTYLELKQVIKGSSVPQRMNVVYPLPHSFMGYVPLNRGLRIVFLRYTQSHYSLADPYRPSFPAVFESVSENNTSSNPLQAVIIQLANVLVSPVVSKSERNEVLGIDYALPNDEYFLAILRSGIANLTDPEAKQEVQRQLILHGDISELPAVTRLLLNSAEAPNQKVGLLYVIGNRVTDVRAVPMVEPLLSSSDPQVRTAAAEALWHIASRSALEPAAKALNDSDPQVRYYAIRALAEITNQPQWGPSIPEYEENGKKYLDYWLEWSKGRAVVQQK